MLSGDRSQELLDAIAALPIGETRLMEVCGTHTMSIAKSGIRSLLPKHIHLISGPGCPVCVTVQEDIDAVLELAMKPDLILTGYGDMLRVPGSRKGDSLLRRRAMGADVRIVYSPMDALDIAEAEPAKQVVFLGIGFETTAPGTAAAVVAAKARGIKNFSLLSMLKSVEPAMRALIETDDFSIDGFLCPGHVATVIGEKGFGFLAEDYRLPGVIGGFEPGEILLAVYLLLKQISEGKAVIQNAYPRAVKPEGNPLACQMLRDVFRLASASWRGLGEIPDSGFVLKDELSNFDAAKRFCIESGAVVLQNGCRCGEVITGRRIPKDCPLFGTGCTPEDPVGPCMVSSEGACAAAYKYQD